MALSGCTTRPTTTTSSRARRRPAGGRDRARPGGSVAFPPDPGLDEPGLSAGGLPPERWWRSTTRSGRHRGGDRPLARPVTGLDAADRGRALLAVLGDRRADARLGQLARGRGVRMHTHLAETLDEEEFCRETFGRTPPNTPMTSAGSGPDVWLAHACTSRRGDRPLRRDRHRRGALPDVERSSRAGHRAGCATCSTRGDGGPGCRRAASNESGRMVDELHQALLAGPFPRWPARAQRARSLGWRRWAVRAARPGGRLGSLEVGKLADVAVAGRRAGRGAASPTRLHARVRRPHAGALFVGGGRWCETASWRGPTPTALAAARRVGRPPGSPSLHPRDERVSILVTASLHFRDGESPISVRQVSSAVTRTS